MSLPGLDVRMPSSVCWQPGCIFAGQACCNKALQKGLVFA